MHSDHHDFDGISAVVTGGAGGIGGEIVSLLRQAGARVASFDLKPGSGADLDCVCDLASDASVQAAAEQARDRIGVPTVVVHAAAASVFGGVCETDSAAFLRVYDVNLVGAVRLLRAFAPGMANRGEGSFLFLSSINARFATPTLAAYAASKAALENLTQTAALELAPLSIRVNAIAPASIDTALLRQSFERHDDPDGARRANVERHPLGRLGTTRDVAELALFLASPRASWITGAIHDVSGGAHVTRR